jgi:serine protease AprX
MTRLIAYFLSDAERDEARDLLDAVESVHDTYVIGEGDERTMDQLQAAGLIVNEVDVTGDRDRASRRSVAGTAGANAAQDRRPAQRLADGQVGSFVLTLGAPLRDDQFKEIQVDGARVVERLGEFSWVVTATNDQAAALTGLEFVREVTRPGTDGWGEEPASGDEAEPLLEEAGVGDDIAVPGPDGVLAAPLVIFDLVLDGTRSVDEVVAELREQGIEIEETASRRVRVRLPEDHQLIRDQRTVAGIAYGFEGDEAALHLDRVRQLMGIDPAAGATEGLPGLDGTGEVIAVLDTGVDVGHPDFQGRVAATKGVDGGPDVTDHNGHGTHVAGIALGSGSAAGGTYRGIAPAAQLAALGSADPQGRLRGLPTTIRDRLEEAVSAGAHTVNNSWGTRKAPSEYTADSWAVDEFVREHPDVVLVFSAGNEASDAGGMFVTTNAYTVTPPGTAKNVITVGASRSDRLTGGDAAERYGVRYPRSATLAPLADETVSGDPEALAAFSGRGPSTDRRIRPDVVAPGTSICSTRSSATLSKTEFVELPENGRYAYSSGTSMAAPAVAGMCALIRQWYRARGVDPSAALIKATLVNGTRWLTGSDAEGSNTEPPNNDQGFGMVDLRTTLPPVSGPWRLSWADTWKTPAQQFTRDATSMKWEVEVRAGTPLRICLTFTDAPGRAIQNDLNLFCQAPGQKPKVLANLSAPDRVKHGLDKDNATEIIRVLEPAAGIWQVVVYCGALTVRDRGQDYALAVSGDLAGELTFRGF